MNVQCGSCPAKYAVPDDKVLGRKVRITCKRCGAAIVVDGTGPSSAKPGQPAAASRVPAPTAGKPNTDAKPVASAPRPVGAVGGAATTSTRPSAAARSALKQTMMGVAPPAPGSLAPVQVSAGPNSAPHAGNAPVELGANAGGAANAAGAAAGLSGAAVPRSADRDIKRTMIGGLNAPAALDNRSAPAGNQPAVAVPRVQPSPADTTPWTVAVTDDQHEEMPIPRIVELFAAGTINEETYIWKQGMDDWQMPFDIPEIAQALHKRGLAPQAKAAPAPRPAEAARQAERMPTAPPPGGMSPVGVWREPGSWNDGVAWKEPALAPGQAHHDVSFDDVTVALAAPQAEALLRDAEAAAALDKDDKDDKDEPTAIFPGGAEAPPLSAPRPVVAVPRPAAGRPAAPRPDPKPTSDAAGLAGHPTPPAIAIETKPAALPVIAVDAAPVSTTPASRRATPVERRLDLFGEVHRAGSEESQPHDDGGAQKLIGERNESSVLFSLDKVVQTEQAHAQSEKAREEELLGLPTARPPPDPQPAAAPMMSAAEEAAIDSALAGPDLSAPTLEKTAPMPDVEPAPPLAAAPAPPGAAAPLPAAAAPPAAAYAAPVSQAVPGVVEEPKPESGSGWLWALLLLLLVCAAAAILIFYLRPAAIFGPPPPPPESAPTALPVPPAPTTELAPAASAPVSPSTGAAPGESSAAAPSAGASAEAAPAPGPKDRAEPRRPRDESSRPPRRERERKPAEDPSEEAPPATDETKPPVHLPPTEREEGPRP